VVTAVVAAEAKTATAAMKTAAEAATARVARGGRVAGVDRRVWWRMTMKEVAAVAAGR
jgi:hypothetical protein